MLEILVRNGARGGIRTPGRGYAKKDAPALQAALRR